mmetsp:Transcript_21314/g.66853  ORF Transcript_21314/g.66853 Transcript_21314/m.66853 type:complete len:612 (-) Transcript_21314:1080-2915(-)
MMNQSRGFVGGGDIVTAAVVVVLGRRRKEVGRGLRDVGELVREDQVGARPVEEGRGNDEGGAFGLDDNVDVVDDQRVGDSSIEGVRGGDEDVEGCGLERQGTASREGVEEVEGAGALAVERWLVERHGRGLSEDGFLVSLHPRSLRLDGRRPQLRVSVEDLEVLVEAFGQGGEVGADLVPVVVGRELWFNGNGAACRGRFHGSRRGNTCGNRRRHIRRAHAERGRHDRCLLLPGSAAEAPGTSRLSAEQLRRPRHGTLLLPILVAAAAAEGLSGAEQGFLLDALDAVFVEIFVDGVVVRELAVDGFLRRELEISLPGVVDHGLDLRGVGLDGVDLGVGRGGGRAVVGEHGGGDLVLDEEVHQGLGQLDLLGERARVEVEDLLDLRLELDHEHGEESRGELHLPECLAEGSLLGRERLDGVCELLGRRDGLEEERDDHLVLVLDNDGVLGRELIGPDQRADHDQEGRELSRTRRELERRRRAASEGARHVCVRPFLAVKAKSGCTVREAHLGAGLDAATHRPRGLAFPANGEAQLAVGEAVGGAAHGEGELRRPELGGEQAPLVVDDVVGEGLGRELLADRCRELIVQQRLKVVDGAGVIVRERLEQPQREP